jgi:hypothetical protein
VTIGHSWGTEFYRVLFSPSDLKTSSITITGDRQTIFELCLLSNSDKTTRVSFPSIKHHPQHDKRPSYQLDEPANKIKREKKGSKNLCVK